MLLKSPLSSAEKFDVSIRTGRKATGVSRIEKNKIQGRFEVMGCLEDGNPHRHRKVVNHNTLKTKDHAIVIEVHKEKNP